MFTALTDTTERLDPKVLVSYWLPALVATFAGVGVLALIVGPPLLDAWVNDLDGIDQIVFGVLLLGITTILALFFKAMRRTILHLFGGDLLPLSIANWAIGRQQRAEQRNGQIDQAPGELGTDAALRTWRSMLDRAIPMESQHMKPTRFGNMMANLEDHTTVVHGMDYRLWWPRLAPLLPDTMRDIVATESANMVGLLNLSLVWTTIALAGAVAIGLIGASWGTAAAVLMFALLLAWVSYRAAIHEGAEASRHYHAAFDLYRHEILKQMALEVPEVDETERALWQRLTAEMLERIIPEGGVSAAPNGSANAAKGETRRSKSPARHRAAADR